MGVGIFRVWKPIGKLKQCTILKIFIKETGCKDVRLQPAPITYTVAWKEVMEGVGVMNEECFFMQRIKYL